MSKKFIFWIVIFAIIIGLLVYAHYVPIWVSITNIIMAIGGIVVGWIARVLYVKYVENDITNGTEQI